MSAYYATNTHPINISIIATNNKTIITTIKTTD